MFDFAPTFADKYAAAKAAFDAAEKVLEDLKKEVIAAGIERIEGVTCDLVLSLVESKRFNQKAAEALLTKEQIDSCKVASISNRITIKAKGL